ncbi:MAG TPA: hypothetical protein VMV44_02385 [Rectinemataceae bacterium]|nr:hypothetical protein [Rectinemataceae bacterium]
MKMAIPFKLTSRHLLYVLAGLASILVAMIVLGVLGVRMPDKLASGISDVVIIGALAVLLYNRKLRADEAGAKAAEEKARADEEERARSEAAGRIEDGAAEDPDGK